MKEMNKDQVAQIKIMNNLLILFIGVIKIIYGQALSKGHSPLSIKEPFFLEKQKRPRKNRDESTSVLSI